MESISSLNQIPKGKLKTVIHLVTEDLLYSLAINFANIEIGKKMPGITWDALPDTNSMWDYIHVGNSWDEFKNGVKYAVSDRLKEAGEDENAKMAAGFADELDEKIDVEEEMPVAEHQFLKIETPPNSEDFKMFQAVVNKGIDSHLEAFVKSKFGGKADHQGKYRMDFHMSEVPLLIRRLTEYFDETGDENALSWANDIEDYSKNPEKFDENSSDSLRNKHGMNAKPETIEESYGDRYENIVFMQGDEADEPLSILDNEGPEAALELLKQWHYPGEHDGSKELPHGTQDKIFEKDGYYMSWNPYIGYIGLVYDTQHAPEEVTAEGSARSYTNLKGKNLKPETLKDKEHPQEIHEARLQVRAALKEYYENLTPPDTEEPEYEAPEITPKKKTYEIIGQPMPPYTFFKGTDRKLYILDAELDKEDLMSYATLEKSDFEKDWDGDSGYYSSANSVEIADEAEAYENLVNVEAEQGKLPHYSGVGSYEANAGSDPYAMYSADSGIIDDIKANLEKGYFLKYKSKYADKLNAILAKFGF